MRWFLRKPYSWESLRQRMPVPDPKVMPRIAPPSRWVCWWRWVGCAHTLCTVFVYCTGGSWMDDAFEGTYCCHCYRVITMRKTY